MKPCKRIEIVIEESLASRMTKCLESFGAPGVTMIPRASGGGDRGLRRADEPTVQRIVEGIRPLLSRFGGICLVSEARVGAALRWRSTRAPVRGS